MEALTKNIMIMINLKIWKSGKLYVVPNKRTKPKICLDTLDDFANSTNHTLMVKFDKFYATDDRHKPFFNKLGIDLGGN